MSEGGCRQGPEGARDARRPGRKPFLLEVRRRIATLTFDRPPVNVLDTKSLREMTAALKRVVGREDIGALVVQGAGRTFSAGVDIGEHRAPTVHAMIHGFHDFCRAILEFPRPTIARVHGAALGGGCEVVLCCDVVVAAASARLGQPEITLGVFPPLSAVLLPRIAGRAAAKMILLGEEVRAEEALRLGIVSEVPTSASTSASWSWRSGRPGCPPRRSQGPAWPCVAAARGRSRRRSAPWRRSTWTI